MQMFKTRDLGTECRLTPKILRHSAEGLQNDRGGDGEMGDGVTPTRPRDASLPLTLRSGLRLTSMRETGDRGYLTEMRASKT
jgi:hypothetical protein